MKKWVALKKEMFKLLEKVKVFFEGQTVDKVYY